MDSFGHTRWMQVGGFDVKVTNYNIDSNVMELLVLILIQSQILGHVYVSTYNDEYTTSPKTSSAVGHCRRTF